MWRRTDAARSGADKTDRFHLSLDSLSPLFRIATSQQQAKAEAGSERPTQSKFREFLTLRRVRTRRRFQTKARNFKCTDEVDGEENLLAVVSFEMVAYTSIGDVIELDNYCRPGKSADVYSLYRNNVLVVGIENI